MEERKQFVYVNHTKSNYLDIKHGVPQGSVLGPLLFLIYVNDIENINDCGELNLFADDTTMFVFGSNVEEIMTISSMMF